jgi:hypothetical protein
MRTREKALLWIGVTLLVLLSVAGLLYLFGGMQPPSAEARATYAKDVAAGDQPPLSARFVIPIPGCVCHSDDPTTQVRHSVRRLSECRGCHGAR